MTAIDVAAVRNRLGLTTDALAAEFNVTPAVVAAWESGRMALTAYAAEWLTWKDAMATREVALASAGMPPCQQVRVLAHAAGSGPVRSRVQGIQLVREHVATCPICTKRQAYVDAHFPPMPPAPTRGWQRVLLQLAALVRRLPPWARPAAVGGGIVFAFVAVRALLLLPTILTHPQLFIGAVVAAVVASGAGIAGGLTYSAVREPFRRLGRLGDYLTGVVCVLVYMGALALVAPLVFGEPLVKEASDIEVFVVISIVFGLLIGHFWLRPKGASGAA
jgi:DNA-binding XRE family transcriptional regulator